MFKKILIPLDGSELATSVLPYGQLIAHAMRGEITLLNVLEPDATTHVNPVDWELRKIEATNYLEEMHKTLDVSLKVRHQLLEGKPVERIIEYACQNEADLLILCSHGRGGVNDWQINGLGQKIIQRTNKSVFLIRAFEAADHEVNAHDPLRILVPLDGSQRAEAVLPFATTLAQQSQAELLFVHVVEQPSILQRTPPTAADKELVDQLNGRNQKEAEEYFTYLKSCLPIDVETKVVVGNNVMSKLHDIVHEEAIDLVLFNAHGRSGIDQWPYGSIVSNFIQYGTTSLLIVQDLATAQQTPKGETEAPELLINALQS